MRRALALVLVVAARPAEGQGSLAPLDSAFNRVRNTGAAPAVAMAVVHKGRVIYTNVAGYADLEHRVLATAGTRFDWASIAKQVTAYAVSLLMDQGELRPSARVRDLLPELDAGGANITVEQLLHHTSGLEDGDGLLVLAGWRPGEPVTHSDMSRLLLRQQHLRFAPGSQHAYSNGGYSLLVEVVQRLTKRAFVAHVDSVILAPLGMRNSGFVDGAHSPIPDRAMPYVRAGAGPGFVPSTSDMYPGAGGLFASVDDMTRWMQHLMRPARDSGSTLRLRERGRLRSGESIDYAWGLVRKVYRGHETFSHGGSGPATSAQLLMIPGLEFGVVAVSAGEVPFDPSALAYRAADIVLGDALGARSTPAPGARRMVLITNEMASERPAESSGIRLHASELAPFAGHYRMRDSSVLALRVQGDGLEFSFGGRPPWMPMHPYPGQRFVRVPWWDLFRFDDVRGGRAHRIVIERTARSLHRDGDSITIATRLPDVSSDSTTARAYLGTYYSDELDALYEVRFDGRRLLLSHARHGVMPLVPVDSTQFVVEDHGIVGARFMREGDRVTGLELEARSWGVTSLFRRVSLR